MTKAFIRWRAKITYRVDRGQELEGNHDLSELEELQEIVDGGPHWDSISKIEIVREHLPGLETLTIEESALLCGTSVIPRPCGRKH